MKHLRAFPVKITVIAAATAIATAGCSALDQASSTCENIRQDIIDLTEEDRASRGYALVAIYEPTEVSKTNKELKCRGKASWSDGDSTGITYKQYIDQEGDIMIEYQAE